MKTILSVVLAITLCSCSSLSPDQKRTAATVGSVSLNLAQAVANTAIKVVLAKAMSDQDLSNKGNYLDSIALGLRTLDTNTGGVISPDLIASTVLQFSDPSKSHWGNLATSLSRQVETSKLPPAQAVEQAAAALNQAAATTR